MDIRWPSLRLENKEPKLYTLPPPPREREKKKKEKSTYSRVNSIQKEKYHFWAFT
jgi:hypothetical protein